MFFVTQNQLDVPETVLSQLGNRVQHALRAYTPREKKAVKTAAETFRPNPDFDCFEIITQLGVGEALVSTLETKDVPSVVQRTLVRPPSSRLGPLTDSERRKTMGVSPVAGRYDEDVDDDDDYDDRGRRKSSRRRKESRSRARSGYRRQTVAEAAIKSAARSGRQLAWRGPGAGNSREPQKGVLD